MSNPSSGTGAIWAQTENEIMAFNMKHSRFRGRLKMGINSLFGMLGSNAAYKSLFKQVLENYNRDFDPSFVAADEMVENVCSVPVNKTRQSIKEYPLLKDSVDNRFPISVIYGEKDIYGDSKRFVRNRFPKAVFVEIKNAGHLPWKHNKEELFKTLDDFYRIQ